MSDTPRNKLSLKREATSEQFKLEERLHKVLAQAGLGSRRALEQRIAEGLVKVNGEVAQTGMSVKSGDKIELDGRGFVATALAEPSRVLVYNKPEGEVTTREDPEGRPTVFESLPPLKGARWIAIGRLDINTTGLLLATTDGELANAMMHPSFEVEREYVVRVRAPEGEEKVSDAIVDRLARGVALEDGPAKFDEIERIGGTDSHDWFRVVVKEGRNREVRRLWESQGCQVSRLKRTRYGKVSLPRELLRGQSVELPAKQVEALRAELKLEEGAPSALTLQPVIGQRRAAKTTVRMGRDGGRDDGRHAGLAASRRPAGVRAAAARGVRTPCPCLAAAGACAVRWPGATARVLIGLAAGALVGLSLAHWLPATAGTAVAIAQPLGKLWLSGLQMTVVPLVLSLVILGVATASDAAASGRVARRAMVVFIALLSLFAAYAAIVAPLVLSMVPPSEALTATLRGTLPAAGAVAAPPRPRGLSGTHPSVVTGAATD